MRVRLPAVLLLFALLFTARASANSPGRGAVLTISPSVGDLAAVHAASIRGLQAGSAVTLVLFDPDGNQLVQHRLVGEEGTTGAEFRPPGGLWQQGIYRVVVGFGDGESTSGVFVASDGQPHLYAGPNLLSPNSAFVLQGSGFAANSDLTLTLGLASGIGSRTLRVTTGTEGTFTRFVWPEQMGFSFWSAGRYELRRMGAGADELLTVFYVRERPNGATIIVPHTVLGTADTPVLFRHYVPARYLWGVYAAPDGAVLGEFLQGPSDPRGQFDASIHFGELRSGPYFIATPYDWGEANFQALAPTPTETSVPSPTPTPTSMPTTTATSLAAAGATHHRCTVKERKRHPKRCKHHS